MALCSLLVSEVHISGDIALAARQYYYATGDAAWLASVGFPLIRGVAAFYASRVSKTADGSREQYELQGVMGPDEYAYGEVRSQRPNARLHEKG